MRLKTVKVEGKQQANGFRNLKKKTTQTRTIRLGINLACVVVCSEFMDFCMVCCRLYFLSCSCFEFFCIHFPVTSGSDDQFL